MPLSLGSTETQTQRVSGAELTALPDGSRSACIATPGGPLFARFYSPAGAEAAVVFAGPGRFCGTFLTLAQHLSRHGIAGLYLRSRPEAEGADGDLAAAAELLGARGVRRMAFGGAGPAAAGALRAAWRQRAEAAALFSPSAPIPASELERLRGRPLFVFAGAEAEAARAIRDAARHPVELHELPGAGEPLAEVLGDLAALCIPRLCLALAAGGPAKP